MSDAPFQVCPAAREVCSTANIGADEWRDRMCGLYSGISFDWLGERPGPAWLGTGPFADVQISELANRPARLVCTPSPQACPDTYDFVLHLTGVGRVRHGGRDAVLEAGDLLLFDTAQPFDIVHPTKFHIVSWRVPREVLAPMLAAPDRVVGLRIAGSDGPGAVLGGYARALATGAGQCDPITQCGLLSHLYGLVGLTLGASPKARESRRQTHRAVRRQQILSYLETHLRDPRLSAQRAARDLRMSLRRLYALLEEGEISFAAWVARRRLEECRQLLGDPAHDHLTVAEIAFRCGFNSLPTFNRRFRAQFGMAPRDARRRADAEKATPRRR